MRETGAVRAVVNVDPSVERKARTVEVEVSSIEEFLRAMDWELVRDDVWQHPSMPASCPMAMAFALTMRTIINDATGKSDTEPPAPLEVP